MSSTSMRRFRAALVAAAVAGACVVADAAGTHVSGVPAGSPSTMQGVLIEYDISTAGHTLTGQIIDTSGRPRTFIEPFASNVKALEFGRMLRFTGGHYTEDASGKATFVTDTTAVPLGMPKEITITHATAAYVGATDLDIWVNSYGSTTAVTHVLHDASLEAALDKIRNAPDTHVFTLQRDGGELKLVSFH